MPSTSSPFLLGGGVYDLLPSLRRSPQLRAERTLERVLAQSSGPKTPHFRNSKRPSEKKLPLGKTNRGKRKFLTSVNI